MFNDGRAEYTVAQWAGPLCHSGVIPHPTGREAVGAASLVLLLLPPGTRSCTASASCVSRQENGRVRGCVCIRRAAFPQPALADSHFHPTGQNCAWLIFQRGSPSLLSHDGLLPRGASSEFCFIEPCMCS